MSVDPYCDTSAMITRFSIAICAMPGDDEGCSLTFFVAKRALQHAYFAQAA